MIYLTLEEVVLLCRRLGDLPIRDLGLLDSAVHRPMSGFAGHEVYPTLELKAAALLHSLAKNHALVDGNKRLSWMSCLVFLSRNGYVPGLTHQEAIDLVLAVTQDLDDVPEIAERLKVTPRG